ncbi:hypothetical protein [Nitrosopumilus sp.]|nr:hypothetical protein [Nitrosopumilus sp.]
MSTNQICKPEQLYENEMHKLNSELQVALLKWKVQSMKKPGFEF